MTNNRVNLDIVGFVCRRARKDNKISMEDVAKLVGCSIMTVSNFERGKNNSASLLLWYVKLFDMTEEYFFNAYERGILNHGELERFQSKETEPAED